ncbi:MAG: ATP synthase subunit C [Oscillospiraceae bacterium]|nr:ATP synthase subunit C [Oscillospiraceae bacterium]
MNLVFLFLMPLIAVAAIMTPLFVTLKRIHDKKPVNRKRSVVTNIISFFGVMIVMTLLPLTGAVAAATDPVASAEGISEGLKYIGAALSTGLGTIGTGVAVGGAAPAAIGAVSENDKSFSKALIFVALGEGVAIYGLLISILILFG